MTARRSRSELDRNVDETLFQRFIDRADEIVRRERKQPTPSNRENAMTRKHPTEVADAIVHDLDMAAEAKKIARRLMDHFDIQSVVLVHDIGWKRIRASEDEIVDVILGRKKS